MRRARLNLCRLTREKLDVFVNESNQSCNSPIRAATGRLCLRQDEELFITQEYINELESEMLEAAERLEFEWAAIIRDKIEEMRKRSQSPEHKQG